MNLATFIESQVYIETWIREVIHKYITPTYQQLDPLQHKLLKAFSVYRKPVPMAGALAVIPDVVDEVDLQRALPKLIRQHLLQAVGQDCYQIPAIVTNCVHHFGNNNQPIDQVTLQSAHSKAAHSYQNAAKSHLSSGQQQRRERAQLLMEAVLHLQQAGKKEEEYDLLHQEDLIEYVTI